MKHTTLWLAGLALTTACSRNEPAPLPPPPATATFTAPAAAQATDALQFKNTSQNATRSAWSFGDGATDKTTSPTHSYAKPGTYQVTLRTYGTHQDSASTTQSLAVADFDILTHTTTKIVGTYDYKQYQNYTYTLYNSGIVHQYSYLQSGTLTVTQTGPGALLITDSQSPNSGTTAKYAPDAGTVADPRGPNIQFLTNVYEYGTAHFYTSGDSLLMTQYNHTARSSNTITYYRAKRRS